MTAMYSLLPHLVQFLYTLRQEDVVKYEWYRITPAIFLTSGPRSFTLGYHEPPDKPILDIIEEQWKEDGHTLDRSRIVCQFKRVTRQDWKDMAKLINEEPK